MRALTYILLGIMFLGACVDPADIEIPPFQYQLVVDGFITTDPGPYTVKMYRSRPLDEADLDRLIPERFAKVVIKDDQGNSELLSEVFPGEYQTKADGMRGVTGRTYHVEITTIDGKQYKSAPELIKPVGEVTAINYEFVDSGMIGQNDEGDGFRIFADATGVSGVDDLIRLRVLVTYMVETFPERKTKIIQGAEGEGVRVPDPFACSGYVNQNNLLVQTGECTCCFCWVTEYDVIPSVFDEQFISNDLFLEKQVGFASVNRRTLYDKIHVEVQELSLTPTTYEYWKLVRAQKEGISNIFQPAIGKLKGNIKSTDQEEALGIFWAAGVNKKSVFIYREEVPYDIQPIDTLVAPCLFFTNSTNQKPTYW